MTRYETLENRREKLIALNKRFGYTIMGNPKMDKYVNCLLEIRKEQAFLLRQNDKKFDKSKYKFSIDMNFLRDLTQPI